MSTYTETTASLAQLEAGLDAAREAKVTAEREAAAAAKAARIATWQDYLNGYNPTALRAAVVDTWAQLCQAAGGRGDLGAALSAHVTAILREGRADSLANDATVAGATPPAGIHIGPGHFRDHTGQDIAEQISTLVPRLLSQAVIEAADATTAAEVEQVQQRADQAYRAQLLAEPAGYRVESARREDYADVIGGAGTVQFADGVAYVFRHQLGDERLDALVRYWRGTSGYQVHEIYDPQVPAHHVEALRRLGDPG